jgi:cytosine/adenosine deaminase-related metal-dependent hydrolase
MHLAEGVDAKSASDISRAAQEFPVDSQCVFVHCLGLDARGRELIRQSAAAVIWCPSSNVFLFDRTLSANELRSFPDVLLGNDSPLTAEGDLLDEIRFAREHIGISSEELYAMVTERAARTLRLQDGEGTIRPGARGGGGRRSTRARMRGTSRRCAFCETRWSCTPAARGFTPGR